MRSIRLSVVLVAVLMAWASPAGAAERPVRDTFKVSTGGLVMTAQPGGGYFGVVTITATYTGSQASVNAASVTLIQPANFAPGSFVGFGACFYNNGYRCSAFQPFVRGVPQTLSVGFTGFAAPAEFARVATAGGSVQFSVGGAPSGRHGTAAFDAVLAAADGSVANPVPYTPSAAPDMGFTASNVVAADGVLSVAVTVKNFNDAANFGASVSTQVPGLSLSFITVSPPTMCLFPSCQVPGGALFEGTERTLLIVWGYSGAPGTYAGNVILFVGNGGPAGSLPDINPADNTVPFTVTIA